MARLYANENFPRQSVEALRQLGHDVITFADVGNAGLAIPDNEVLAYAAKDERAIITLNRRDFIRLHNQNPDHAGIIVCTQDPDTIGQARRIAEAINQTGVLKGQLLRIYRPQK